MKNIEDMSDSLTLQQIQKRIKELIKLEEENDKNIFIERYCITNGTVLSSPMRLNLCDNVACPSCNDFKKAIEEIHKTK